MAKRKAAKRELIDTRSSERVEKGGRFKESDDVGRSTAADRVSGASELSFTQSETREPVEQHLQVLDVVIVDVLAHLEALLRHTHSLQRALLQFRNAAPPPGAIAPHPGVLHDLREHSSGLQREWDSLGQVIQDLTRGVDQIVK